MQDIDIKTPDGTMDAKLFQPAGQGSWPAVIMLTDAGGSRPVYEKKAQTLADQGYVVLLPNVYYREGRSPLPGLAGGSFADEAYRKRIMGLIASLTPERIKTDGAAELGFLATCSQVKGSGVGVVGHCMSGAMAMRMMADFPDRVVAAASYHGGHLATDAPDSPHLLASKLKGELYFAHADKDEFIDANAIARLEAALKDAGARFKSELYVGARHGFSVETSPVYNAEAAERHWQAMFELFGRTLRA